MAEPILSWGLENIDKNKVKEKVSKVSSGLGDTMREVLAEIKASSDRANVIDRAGRAGREQLFTGMGEMAAGALGAVPIAVGKTLGLIPENVQKGIGNLIGATPINPSATDYGSNPGLELAGQGYDRFKTGLMSTLDLKKSPTTPAAINPAVAGKPTPASPLGITSPQTAPITITPAQSAPGTSSPATLTPPAAEGIVPPSPTDNQTVYKYTDTAGKQGLTNIPDSIPAGSKSSILLKSPGLANPNAAKDIRDEIANLRAMPPEINPSTKKEYIPKDRSDRIEKLLGHLATVEGHALTADMANDVRSQTLAETKRYNDIKAEDVDLKRKADMETKLAAQTLKNSDSFNKSWDLVSPTVGVDEAGKPIKARDVGLLDILDTGQKFRDKVPELYPAAQQLWDRREQWVVDQFKKNKRIYNPLDINKPGTETYEVRRRAIKTYRDELMKRYTPAS
jgi:hypothetical protein